MLRHLFLLILAVLTSLTFTSCAPVMRLGKTILGMPMKLLNGGH